MSMTLGVGTTSEGTGAKLIPVARTLLGAPRRYIEFLAATARTDFFGRGDSADSDRSRCRISVLAAVYPPAFAKYTIATAVTDVLRYALLTATIGVSKADLALVVGSCDAACAILDALLSLQGSWDAHKANIVAQRSGPVTSSALYGVGVALVVLSATAFGCGSNDTEEEQSQKEHPQCTTYYHALALFTVGSYFMKLGQGLLWNVWTQTFKHHAEKQLKFNVGCMGQVAQSAERGCVEEGSDGPHVLSRLDFQGKISQIQVLIRYAASSFAPLFAAYLLFRTGQSPGISYLIVGLSFILLCLVVAFLVVCLGEESDYVPKEAKSSNNGNLVQWSEMLPVWATSWLRSTGGETTPIIAGDVAGRFSFAFVHCGMFSSLTEVVRGGYTRIICLRAATSSLSHTDLSHILSIAGFVALSSFWLSDLADENRRLAAFLSFAILAAGHFGLALSTSMIGFCSSAAVFGLGEGISTGLRALIKQDYLHEHGPLGELTRHSANGRLLRRQVCNKIGIWTDVTLIMNSMVVGIIGHFLGMQAASFAFGFVAIYAMYFSRNILPDTKPRE